MSRKWSYRHTRWRSRLVQLLLGSGINTEQIGGDLQPLLFDLSSSCHISWHCPSATLRGAGRTGMASTCLPGLFSVFFPFQLIPLCLLHAFSCAHYKSSLSPGNNLDSRDLQSAMLTDRGGMVPRPAARVEHDSLFKNLMVGWWTVTPWFNSWYRKNLIREEKKGVSHQRPKTCFEQILYFLIQMRIRSYFLLTQDCDLTTNVCRLDRNCVKCPNWMYELKANTSWP